MLAGRCEDILDSEGKPRLPKDMTMQDEIDPDLLEEDYVRPDEQEQLEVLLEADWMSEQEALLATAKATKPSERTKEQTTALRVEMATSQKRHIAKKKKVKKVQLTRQR